MYGFIDTTERTVKNKRPAEALNINGQYIEDVIEGYQTLNVSGRELLEEEIVSNQKGINDGEEYGYKRHTPRVITVTYKITSASSEKFREAFNKLNKFLNVEQSKLIFDDEPDKYFVGTKGSNSTVEAGLNSVRGEFELFCADPRKHAITEKSFSAVSSGNVLETTIVNNGTESVPISYDIRHNHENGFVGIASAHGVIELGSPAEIDGQAVKKSENLVGIHNYSGYNPMATGQGKFFQTYGMNGTFKETVYEATSYLDVASAGTGSGWHGAAKSMQVPVDSGGVVGAKNFSLQGKVWFRPTKVNQLGMVEYAVADEAGNNLMSMRIAKWDPVRELACIILCIGGKEVKRIEFNPFYSQIMVHKSGEFYMAKTGSKFVFCMGGIYSFEVPELEQKLAKTISVFIGQRDNYDMVEKMRLQYLIFRKDNVEKWEDIPNRYAEGTRIHIDGNSTKVYVDGNERARDVLRGSKFFLAPPGATKVQFYFSDFCKPLPTVTATIREAYL